MFWTTRSFLVLQTLLLSASFQDGSTISINKKPQNDSSKNELYGIVSPVQRCGGLGTFLELRISDCNGQCSFIPGRVYDCENDFMPSSAAPSLTLRLEICSRGACFVVLTSDIPNSSVQPGYVYTAKYSIVPNDALSGQSVQFYAYIYHTDNSIVEVCTSAIVNIEEVN